MLVIVFIQLAKSVLTLLYIKRKAQTPPYSRPGLAQPSYPYVEAYAQRRTLQWIWYCSFFLSRCKFGLELSILSVGPSHKLGDKCDRLHICSRKTHIDCKFRHYFRILQKFIRIYFVLRLKILKLSFGYQQKRLFVKFVEKDKNKNNPHPACKCFQPL